MPNPDKQEKRWQVYADGGKYRIGKEGFFFIHWHTVKIAQDHQVFQTTDLTTAFNIMLHLNELWSAQ